MKKKKTGNIKSLQCKLIKNKEISQTFVSNVWGLKVESFEAKENHKNPKFLTAAFYQNISI